MTTRCLPPLERFMKYVSHEPNSGCWLWEAALSKKGYSQFRVEGKTVPGHRFIYERTKGKIPKSLTIDHLCKIKCCVNPDHMEPVTSAVNTHRAFDRPDFDTHCVSGHSYEQFGILNRKRERICRECQRISAIQHANQKRDSGLAYRKTKQGWRWIDARLPSRKGNNQFIEFNKLWDLG